MAFKRVNLEVLKNVKHLLFRSIEYSSSRKILQKLRRAVFEI